MLWSCGFVLYCATRCSSIVAGTQKLIFFLGGLGVHTVLKSALSVGVDRYLSMVDMNHHRGYILSRWHTEFITWVERFFC